MAPGVGRVEGDRLVEARLGLGPSPLEVEAVAPIAEDLRVLRVALQGRVELPRGLRERPSPAQDRPASRAASARAGSFSIALR